MHTVLIIDANNLAWKSFHAIKNLSHELIKTNVIFGMMKQVQAMVRSHAASALVFCFDDVKGKESRQEIYEHYKANRSLGDAEQKKARGEMRKELLLMEKEYLPKGGFKNVFSAEGFEADDLIASLTLTLPSNWRAVIASSDQDMYQLLSDRVMIWNGKTMVTKEKFTSEFGVTPSKWVLVKALAGCSSDNIPGVSGVGEKMAIKYLCEGKVGPKKDVAILQFIQSGDYDRNRKLVELPFPDCPTFTFAPGMPDQTKFNTLMKRLGIKSISSIGGNDGE